MKKLYFPILFVLAACNQPDYNRTSLASDSLSTDTSKIDSLTSNSEFNDENTNLVADAFKSISVTKDEFKAIYKSAKKIGDEFSSDKYFQDKTSPVYVNRNGIYLSVKPSTIVGANLYLNIQYYADDWLFIKSMTFNVDGNNFDYEPDRFKTDNGDGMIWEWSSEMVDGNNYQLLIALATGKKAKVKYFGSQYYKVVPISKAQQIAMLRMLKLYKGFYLKYDK